jgi:hypothetical protein
VPPRALFLTFSGLIPGLRQESQERNRERCDPAGTSVHRACTHGCYTVPRLYGCSSQKQGCSAREMLIVPQMADSVLAKPNKRDPEANQKDPYPASDGDAFAKKDNTSQRTRRVA